MANTVVIDPVTRIEGHLRVSITVDVVNSVQQITDAQVSGTLFRGFERILLQRHPWDAPHICARICGVCPISQSSASVLGLEQASNTITPDDGILLRNLMGAANFIDSHILSFYHLSLPDYILGPAMSPFQPSWKSDRRLDDATTSAFVLSYIAALDFRRKAQELGAIFGGRMPHAPALSPGGMTTTIRAERVTRFKSLLTEVASFVKNDYLADVECLATAYDDYYKIGRGHGDLLAFGAFGDDATGTNNAPFQRGYMQAGEVATSVNTRAIAEHVTHSWYDESTSSLKPNDGETTAQYPKDGAYSWLKAPRYNGRPCEVGPLARMTIGGGYNGGVSVMDRHMARAAEAAKLVKAMATWIDRLKTKGVNHQMSFVPESAAGEGLTEAPRGALGHWLRIEDMRIANYQIVTPTCWNASPRDSAGVRGPMEEALVGTPILDVAEPVEALRVIHSFDPCTACAVHVMRPGRQEAVAILNSR
jgi:hydrogenase large subunit